jgi:hypothetical protein
VSVVLAIVGSLAVVAGIVGVAMRGAKADLAASELPIAKQNEALQSVGSELGLVYVPSDGYGELRGQHANVAVTVRFHNAYYDYWIQIRVPGSKRLLGAAKTKFREAKVRIAGDELLVEPRVTKEKAGRAWHWVILDPAELRRWIDEVATLAATKN